MFAVKLRLKQKFAGLKCVFNFVMSTTNNKRRAIDNKIKNQQIKIPRRNVDEVTLKSLPTKSTIVATSTSKMANFEVMDTPDKAARDKKDYRIIKLSNGLKALLISDPVPIDIASVEEVSDSDSISSSDESIDGIKSSTSDESDAGASKSQKQKLAACSLCVDVGSFSDPRDVQGLAHFLEHMIFMGSEKYPNENEYDQYIKKCGGFDNADTDFEETSFYFEVAEQSLDGALDRFANLFKSPLMRKEAMTREREAVESEFLSKRQGDDIRREQLLSSLATAEHPSSIFCWGNLKTLKENINDDDLYRKVHEFRKRHYSAHRMFVCIQARLPLDTLQDLLIKHFADIPSNNFPGDDFSKFNGQNVFQRKFSENIFIVKPVANFSKIDVTFCLDSLIKEYKCKPHYFVSYLLGHEGKGSLCQYLRDKLWALELIAGVDESGFGTNSLYSLFTITVYLTQKGFQHITEIVDAIFSYLRFLHNKGPNEALFYELQAIEENSFRFQNERQALENVENLVVNLKYYPPKHILTGSNLYFEYNAEDIKEVLNQINKPDMNIVITTKMPFNDHPFDLVEPWFGTEYCSIPYPTKWYEMWKNSKPYPEFAFPPSNPFIASDFTILYEKDKSVVPDFPEKILETDICELWFKQDNKFLLPIAYYHLYFISPIARCDPEKVIMMTLYSLLLKYKLVERLYPATVAGLEYSCFSSENGLVLKINGFNQKLHVILEAFTNSLTNFANDVTEEQFHMFVEQQLRNYYNKIIKQKSFAKALRLSIVDNSFIPTIDKFEKLKKIKLSDFKKFAAEFLEELKIQALFQGNLEADGAKKIMINILDNLKSKKINNTSALNLQSNKIPTGNTYIRCKAMNQSDVNTVTTNFYQIGPINIRKNCLIDLLMIVTEEPLFDILRSKEQLGYDVSCSIRDNYGILGYTIVINSQEDKFTAEHIDERIEAFRSDLVNIIKKLSPEDFQQFRESVIKIKLTDDNELKDEVCRNWAEITTEEYIFDRNKREVECLRSITQEEFTEFYVNHHNNGNRKLSIQVIGNKDSINNPQSQPPSSNNITDVFQEQFSGLQFVQLSKPEKGDFITNIDKFRKNLEIYPVTKTPLTEENLNK